MQLQYPDLFLLEGWKELRNPLETESSCDARERVSIAGFKDRSTTSTCRGLHFPSKSRIQTKSLLFPLLPCPRSRRPAFRIPAIDSYASPFVS